MSNAGGPARTPRSDHAAPSARAGDAPFGERGGVHDAGAGDAGLRERITTALRAVIDPELGLDVVDLGLVYGIDVEGDAVRVQLTMTTPACPLGEHIVRDAKARLAAVEGVATAHVDLVWEPPWSPERMSDAAKEALGWSR